MEKSSSQSQGSYSQDRYRVVRYFYQWPQGDEFVILGENLSKEDAESLRKKQEIGLKDEQITVEKMN